MQFGIWNLVNCHRNPHRHHQKLIDDMADLLNPDRICFIFPRCAGKLTKLGFITYISVDDVTFSRIIELMCSSLNANPMNIIRELSLIALER